MIIINESGLYRLMFSSRLPTAQKFTSWVTSEVLLSIRKHGLYAIDELVKNPKLLRSVVDELIRGKEQREALEAENIMQKQMIAELEPIKRYVDVILSSHQAVTITQIAADYALSGRRLNEILHEEGVQWKVGGQWGSLSEAYLYIAQFLKQNFSNILKMFSPRFDTIPTNIFSQIIFIKTALAFAVILCYTNKQ